MLKRIMELYEAADDDKIKALAALDDRVDRKHAAIKLYLAKVTSRTLTEAEALRCQELIGACVKLEQVGDIIVRNMLAHVKKKLDRGPGVHAGRLARACRLSCGGDGQCALAFNVLVSRDPETARQLVEEKDRLRDLEKATSQSHFLRLRDGTAEKRRDQFHPSRHDPRPEADQLAARLDGLSGARGAGPAQGFAAGCRLSGRLMARFCLA